MVFRSSNSKSAFRTLTRCSRLGHSSQLIRYNDQIYNIAVGIQSSWLAGVFSDGVSVMHGLVGPSCHGCLDTLEYAWILLGTIGYDWIRLETSKGWIIYCPSIACPSPSFLPLQVSPVLHITSCPSPPSHQRRPSGSAVPCAPGSWSSRRWSRR